MFDNQNCQRDAAFAQGYKALNGPADEEAKLRYQPDSVCAPTLPRGATGDPFPLALPAPLGDDDLTIEERDGVLFVGGDIDLYQASRFRAQAEAYITTTDAPRLDLTDVLFIDSAGLAALLMLSRGAKADGKTVTVVATGAPRRVLRITGIDQAIKVEE